MNERYFPCIFQCSGVFWNRLQLSADNSGKISPEKESRNMQFCAINDFFLAFKNVLECVATMHDCFDTFPI